MYEARNVITGAMSVRVQVASQLMQPIDAANNALVNFSSKRNIRIERINWRNGINGEARSIWCHIGNLVCTLN